MDLRHSDSPIVALREYGKYANVLLSKVDACYDEKRHCWNEAHLGLLKRGLDETMEQIKNCHAAAYGGGRKVEDDDQEWKPLRGW